MKLTDLEPRWGQNVMMNHAGAGQSNFAPSGFRNAVSFLCPHCVAIGNRSQRLAVTFTPPIGPLDWLIAGQPPGCDGATAYGFEWSRPVLQRERVR